MFAHLADETRNLCHGFLGALFSVILVLARGDTLAVLAVCGALYLNFVFITAALHFYFKAVHSNGNSGAYLMYAIGLTFISFFTWLLLLVFVASGKIPFLTIDKDVQVCVGIGLYGAFVFMMAIAHFSAMSSVESRNPSEDKEH